MSKQLERSNTVNYTWNNKSYKVDAVQQGVWETRAVNQTLSLESELERILILRKAL